MEVRPTPRPLPPRGGGEECVEVDLPFRRQRQVRQQRLQQRFLARLEGAGFDAAVGSQVSGIRCQVSAPLAAARTRSRVLYLIGLTLGT
jgi:hypothetical protein